MSVQMGCKSVALLSICLWLFCGPLGCRAESGEITSVDGASQSGSSFAAGEHGEHGEHADHPHETLIFMFGIIVVGIILLQVTTFPLFHNLQFTVCLFVLGVGFAMVAEHTMGIDTASGMMYRSYINWMAIDPHLLLFTFLPPLLTGDAMAMDTHVAKRTCKQCLLLAGPGVLIGAFSTASFLYFCLPYGWDFFTSLTVGSILAATDPVAVVGLLKELGASPVLTMLIQGESLLNDGTAMVLFTIAYGLTAGEEYSPTRIVTSVLKSTIGAALLGGTVGYTTFLWMRSASDRLCHSNSLIQISLTIACAYWSFLVAEGVCHISGVISTVSAAVVLAHKMWPIVIDRQAMMDIWHVIETLGNTLVFFLAGAMTGKAMLRIDWMDYVWLLVIYIAALVIRLTMLIAFMPIMNRLGASVTLADVLVMWWGGLRGMVGLALAILVKVDLAKGNLSELDGDRVLFHVGGIAALTLIINATTSPRLVGWLGITATPDARSVLIKNVAKRGRKHVESLVHDLVVSKDGKNCNPGVVKDMVEKVLHEVEHHLGEDLHKHHAAHSPKHSPKHGGSPSGDRNGSPHSGEPLSPTHGLIQNMLHAHHEVKADVEKLWEDFDSARCELLSCKGTVKAFQFGSQLDAMKFMLSKTECDPTQLLVVREVFLQSVRSHYWEQMQDGRFLVGSVEPELLLDSVNMAMELCYSKLADWDFLLEDIHQPEKPAPKPPKDCPKSKRAAFAIASSKSGSNHSLMSDQSTQSGPEAMQRFNLKQRIAKMRATNVYEQQSLAVHIATAFIDAHTHAQAKIASYFGDDEEVDSPEEAYVIIESQINVFRAAALMGLMPKRVLSTVNTMWHVHRIAEQYRHYVLGVHESGVLLEKEAEVLLHPIGHTMQQLNKDRRRIFAKHKEANKEMHTIDAVLRIQRAYRAKKALGFNSCDMQGLVRRISEMTNEENEANLYTTSLIVEGCPVEDNGFVYSPSKRTSGSPKKKGASPMIASGTSPKKSLRAVSPMLVGKEDRKLGKSPVSPKAGEEIIDIDALAGQLRQRDLAQAQAQCSAEPFTPGVWYNEECASPGSRPSSPGTLTL